MTEIRIGETKKIHIEKKGNEYIIDGETRNYDFLKSGENHFKVFSDQVIYNIEVLERKENEILLSVDGASFSVSVTDPMDKLLKKLGMESASSSSVRDIKAPMPGTILSVEVTGGESIQKGDSLLILEAMKMENVIKSPQDGVIKTVSVSAGDNVEKNQILISFD